MIVDVVVTWPRHCDYPLWRAQLGMVRERFARVLVAFTNHHQRRDYSGFVGGQLEALGCDRLDASEDNRRSMHFHHANDREIVCRNPTCQSGDSDLSIESDWRDRAVNACLERSEAEWVWFTEQDLLLCEPDRFLDALVRLVDGSAADAFGWREAGSDRWHPSCLLVRREAIERTSRYFGPVPVDHFWRFGRELGDVCDLGAVFRFGSILADDVDVIHLAGLSHNHALVDAGGPVTYKPDEFACYLECCLAVAGPLERAWANTASRWLADRPR